MEKDKTIWRCELRLQYHKYKKDIDASVKRVFKSGRYTLADEVYNFEKEFAKYVECKYAVGVGNATDGLILAMKVLGIGAGDEVITTPFTAIPTISAVIAAGAKPVFTDIDEKTFLIDIDKIPNFITPKTKAVIPVHIFGNVVDVQRLRTVIPSNIPVIEDSAQSHGSRINGIHSGSMGDIGVFSFYPTKNLGGYGDGGAVVTNNSNIAEKIRLMRMYGMIDKDHIVINGINSRLDELQAAILRIKLKCLDDMNELRNKIANRYKNKLDSNYLSYQYIPDNVLCNYHVFAAKAERNRNALMDYLESQQIQTNIYYPIPLHLQEANKYLGYKTGDFPIAEQLCNQVIALPMYPELSEQKLSKVIKAINKFTKEQQI